MDRRRIQRFEIIEQLGSGGMGSVFRAYDPQLDRDVSIKVLNEPASGAQADLPADQTIDLRTDLEPSTEGLLAEARMMAKLSHPNVLPVYEVGLTDGSVFLVMEYVDGSDLHAWLEQRHPLDAILAVFAQAAHGLEAAHARGIVHRDFKPHNVLIGRDRRVRVADFGLSRFVVRPTSAMVRIDDGQGTPKYMAPELWHGQPATPKSDVFAFCVTLHDALEGCEVSPELRALIAAGIADDPHARPELAAVQASLGGRAPARARRWIIGGAAAGAALVTSVLVALGAGGGGACDVDPSMFDGRWDAARRAETAELLRANATPTTSARIDRILGALEDAKRELETELAATCRGEDAGTLTAAQAASRRACLERRAIELGVAVERLPANKPDPAVFLVVAEEDIDQLPRAAECAELEASPLPQDRAPVIALYTRLYGDRTSSFAKQSELASSLEVDALARGEHELAVRAALWRGTAERRNDHLDVGDQALQRASKLASTIHATDLQARALLERSQLAAQRNDSANATSFAELAKELVDRPTVSPRTRVQVQYTLGRAAVLRGDFKGAAELLQEALDAAQERGRQPWDESAIRFQLSIARMSLGHTPATVAFARETVELTRTQLGEHATNLGIAYNILATALTGSDPAAALGYRRKALALMIETLGPSHSRTVVQRMDIANELYRSGTYEEARVEFAQVLAECDKNAALASTRPTALGLLAVTSFGVGRYDEGLAISEQAVAEGASAFGIDSVRTLDYRRWRVDMELELGRYEDAARHLDELERTYRMEPRTGAEDVVMLDGYFRARLALGRGKLQEAEKRVRDALAASGELRSQDLDRVGMLRILGGSLVAQRRFAAARAALDEARSLAPELPAYDAARAAIDVSDAEAEVGLGQRDEALARARRARDVLARFPGELIARKRVAALLAVLERT